jgi:hypothetical protein
MKKIIAATAMVAGMTLAGAGAASAQGASECGAGYGALHKGFATSGLTGQGPNRGGHVPGQAHGGAAGICGVGNGAG